MRAFRSRTFASALIMVPILEPDWNYGLAAGLAGASRRAETVQNLRVLGPKALVFVRVGPTRPWE